MITFARPYAKALLSFLNNEEELTNWCNFIDICNKHLSVTKEKTILSSKVINQFAIDLKLEKQQTKFLLLLQSSNRLDCLLSIKNALKDLWYEKHKILSVEITTINKLSDTNKSRLESEIIKKYGACLFTYIVNENIIGGMIIKFPDKTIDTSYINKIKNFKQLLHT